MGEFPVKVAVCGCKCAFVRVQQHKTVFVYLFIPVDVTDGCLLGGEKQLMGPAPVAGLCVQTLVFKKTAKQLLFFFCPSFW